VQNDPRDLAPIGPNPPAPVAFAASIARRKALF